MWAVVDMEYEDSPRYYAANAGSLLTAWTQNWCKALLTKTRKEAERIAFEATMKYERLLGRIRVKRIDRWVLATTIGVGYDGQGPTLSDEFRKVFFNEGHSGGRWGWGWESATHYMAWQDAGFMLPEALKVLPVLKNHVEVARLDRVYGL